MNDKIIAQYYFGNGNKFRVDAVHSFQALMASDDVYCKVYRQYCSKPDKRIGGFWENSQVVKNSDYSAKRYLQRKGLI